MAVTAYAYANAAKHLAAGDINFTSNTIKAALLSNSYSLSVNSHEFVSSVTSAEIVGGSYTRKTLASKTANLASNVLTLDCADISWTSITAVNIRYIVFFKDTGSDATSLLLCVNDLGQNYNPSAQNFDYTVSPSGLITLSV